MLVAISLSAEGVNPHAYYPCETYIRELIPLSEHEGLQWEETFLPKGESEYDSELWGDVAEDEDEEGKDKAYAVNVGGLVPFRVAMSYLEHIGAFYGDVQTMGTLGGPANPIGWAPDTSWIIESRLVVASVRVTPVVPTEASWNRVLRLFEKYDAWDLAHMGRR